MKKKLVMLVLSNFSEEKLRNFRTTSLDKLVEYLELSGGRRRDGGRGGGKT